jgi:hypothetical protein
LLAAALPAASCKSRAAKSSLADKAAGAEAPLLANSRSNIEGIEAEERVETEPGRTEVEGVTTREGEAYKGGFGLNVLRFVAGVKLDRELVVVPRITGAAAFGALKGEGAAVAPRITGAAAFGALKGEEAAVVPRITGAAAFGALKGEEAAVVPRITGSGGTTSGPLNGEGGALRSGAFVVLAGIAARLAWFLALISSRRALSLAAASAFALACCS